jgi:hypothetical protein
MLMLGFPRSSHSSKGWVGHPFSSALTLTQLGVVSCGEGP